MNVPSNLDLTPADAGVFLWYNSNMLEIRNKLGDIRFSRNVIFKIVDDAIASCGGRVSLYNYRGKYKNVMPGKDEVKFTETPQGVDITVFVVINFGVSIHKSTEKIRRYIYENVEKVMGEKPHSVKIVVTGVQSKEIAKRHIEIG